MATPMLERAESRRRRRARLVGAGLALLLAAGAAGAVALGRTAQRDPQFRLAALEVRGLRLLTGTEVLRASGVAVGDHLFEVDLDAVAARLSSLVWVRQVRVERKPPDRLVVHLEERRRVAWIEVEEGRLHGIDEDGVLLPPEPLPSEGVEDLDLPVLRRPDAGALEVTAAVGQVLADSAVRRMLTWWLAATAQAPDLAEEISEIAPLDSTSLRLRLVADDLEVRLPPDRVAARLATLHEVLRRVYAECPNPAYIDLRFAGQAVIGTHPAVAPAPPEGDPPSAVGGEAPRSG